MARTKKLYSFIPENEKQINIVISDITDVYGTTESATVEKLLTEQLYGNMEMTKILIREMYNSGINKCLDRIYRYFADTASSEEKNTDILDFVKFSLDYMIFNNLDLEIDKEKNNYWDYFCKKFTALKMELGNSIDSQYVSDSFISISDIVFYIIRFWDTLKDSSYTFRILMACHRMIELQNDDIPLGTPSQRLKLREIILKQEYCFFAII